MSLINVSNLTFAYEGSFDNIFENVSFHIDTDWKLGFIGRNGKGKTTFLNLLLGKYEYSGSISTNMIFEYFPFHIENEWMGLNTVDVLENIYPEYEMWRVCMELEQLKVSADVLYQRFDTLSFGERTKVMLALLFSKENHFMLIDEPTNHLDMDTRQLLVEYLGKKKGYILVSHDRYFLDKCIDHVLVLNRQTIEVQSGNFSTWWENKQKKDAFELSENEKLKKEVGRLKETARQSAMWADKVESTKIGYNPIKDTDRCIDTRAYIGEKSKRMQQRRKNLERRQNQAIQDKEKLLKDLETPAALKMNTHKHHKETYVRIKDFSCSYDNEKWLTKDFSMEINYGDRVILTGRNGCGKSTIVKLIHDSKGVSLLNSVNSQDTSHIFKNGTIEVASGLKISYINQDTSAVTGNLDEYIRKLGMDNSLFKSILRQLDFERVQFEKSMDEYSLGQKKKVLIAGSLLEEADLYIWDEPLNYVDVFSQIQIEELILKYKPTMLIIDHDRDFVEKIGTKMVHF